MRPNNTHHTVIQAQEPKAQIRTLSLNELEHVSGGVKVKPSHIHILLPVALAST